MEEKKEKPKQTGGGRTRGGGGQGWTAVFFLCCGKIGGNRSGVDSCWGRKNTEHYYDSGVNSNRALFRTPDWNVCVAYEHLLIGNMMCTRNLLFTLSCAKTTNFKKKTTLYRGNPPGGPCSKQLLCVAGASTQIQLQVSEYTKVPGIITMCYTIAVPGR